MIQHFDDDDFKENISGNEQTSCVAWFKLAELITRKEKEKALSLHRLLSHSLENKAYSLQLEGDILWSLEDFQALEKYQQAAFLYKKDRKIVNAIAIYEHLLTLQPQNFDFLSTLIYTYLLYDWPEKFQNRVELLLEHLDNEIINRDQFLDVAKKIINFISGDQKINKELIDDGFFIQKNEKQAEIILKSLLSILSKKNKFNLIEDVEQYCLEKNLKFGS